MGVFDTLKKTSNQSLIKTTKGFYIGSPEAEAENNAGIQNLEHYFEDFLEILPLVTQGKFIIIGRKGSGKSAIAKFIKDLSDKTDKSYCDLIRLHNIDLEKLVQKTDSFEIDNKEILLFEWLILIRLVKLLIQNP